MKDRQAAGARFDEIELSAFVNLVAAADRRRAAEDLARSRGWTSATPEQVLSMPAILVGDTDRVIEELQARRERSGLPTGWCHRSFCTTPSRWSRGLPVPNGRASL
jgi:alkanesulfonate monooxygenase SsuD/methylene tetrahydromethanopterin reductase-like flavin-dependent oxidoreductase (luciferase family)